MLLLIALNVLLMDNLFYRQTRKIHLPFSCSFLSLVSDLLQIRFRYSRVCQCLRIMKQGYLLRNDLHIRLLDAPKRYPCVII